MAKIQGRSFCGPGYKSPTIAMKEGPRESILYVVCPHTDSKKADVLCTVDVDPNSPTYCQIIHKLRMPEIGDELHHSGWNICSSCHDSSRKRDTLVLPCLMSDRIYFVNTSDERAPKIKKVLDPKEMHEYGVSTPHTSHCSPNGEIIISTMGKYDNDDGQGEFFCVDAETLEAKGTWTKGEKKSKFGYDFWYQPYHDVLTSSEWGVPRVFKKGYAITDGIDPEIYGRSLNFYSWKERKLVQSINLGEEGIAPLEVRFLHEPTAAEGYVGCAVSSNVWRFYKNPNESEWHVEKVIDVPSRKVDGWIAPSMPGMITDILLSLDDKYLYLSNWLHGDVRQYDISDRRNPKLTGQVFLGGSLLEDSEVREIDGSEPQPRPVFVKGRRLYGSPQMLQLSLDGRRLYVTSSLFKPWDKQFYPELVEHGSTMVKLDIDVDNGGMTLDDQFLIDFGTDKDDVLLAHEVRYPGGDCTSDIWLAPENA